MSATDLRFVGRQPASLDLRFGAEQGGSVDVIDIGLSAALVSGEVIAHVPLDRDQAVNRSPKAWAASGWQEGQRASQEVACSHESPPTSTREIRQALRPAVPLPAELSTPWESYRRDRATRVVVPLEKAAPLRGHRGQVAFDSLAPCKPAVATAWDDARPVKALTGAPWVSLSPIRRPRLVMPWGDGVALVRAWRMSSGAGLRRRLDRRAPWEEARRPPPGISDHGGVVPPRPPHYEPAPGNAVDLRFVGRLPASLDLRFGLSSNPPTTETIVVPVRSIYMIKNTQTLVLADSGDEIPATNFRLDIDHQSFTWSWSATISAKALPRLLAGAVGEAVEVIVTLNGQDFRLLAEKPGRGRQFAKAEARIAGRGRAAGLSAPYAERTYRTNADVSTAQQLMAAALTENSVSLGWDLDWQISDWIVPAGAWAHTGTPMEACQAIAEAAGAYIQGHRKDKRLAVLPRYPAAPWAWSGLTPDIELPEDVVTVEDLDWEDKPLYNAIYVAGQKDGVLGHVVRTGTAGDKLKDMVTDPLITDATVARMRGLAELSDTGRVRTQQLTLQHLPETGIILPGKLLRYRAEGKAYIGIVRGTGVEAGLPKQRQTLRVECHDL